MGKKYSKCGIHSLSGPDQMLQIQCKLIFLQCLLCHFMIEWTNADMVLFFRSVEDALVSGARRPLISVA